jgi:hypothetical protein
MDQPDVTEITPGGTAQRITGITGELVPTASVNVQNQAFEGVRGGVDIEGVRVGQDFEHEASETSSTELQLGLYPGPSLDNPYIGYGGNAATTSSQATTGRPLCEFHVPGWATFEDGEKILVCRICKLYL